MVFEDMNMSIKWHDENGVQTTEADDIPMFLAAVESADKEMQQKLHELIREKYRGHAFPHTPAAALHRQSIWFRGHNSPDYELIPSLLRNQPDNFEGIPLKLISTEKDTLSQFRDNALRLSDNPLPYDASNADWLALGQHYGLKTRLLDFTTNPLTALAFAFDGNEHAKHVVVYIFDSAAYMIDYDPDRFQSLADATDASFSSETAVESVVPDTINKEDKQYIDKHLSFTFTEGSKPPLPIKVLPLNRRLVAQSGAFLMWQSDRSSLENMGKPLRFFRKIKIRNDGTSENRILIHLSRFGFSPSSLYADLSQAARGINTNYKFNLPPWPSPR